MPIYSANAITIQTGFLDASPQASAEAYRSVQNRLAKGVANNMAAPFAHLACAWANFLRLLEGRKDIADFIASFYNATCINSA